jgi:hypothetical protein
MPDDKTGIEGEGQQSAINDEIKDFVVKAVNGAVSTHLSRALGKRDEALKAELQGMFAQFKPPVPETPPKPDAATGDSEAMRGLHAKYEKQIAELREAADREKSQREQEFKKRMSGEERESLKSYLVEHGVPPALVPAAVAYLHGELKRVARDDDGNIQYVSQEKGPTGNYEDRVPLKDGVERFLKSDEGKHFLPAKPVGGAGVRGGGAGGKSNAPQSTENMILDFLNGALNQ